MSRAVVIIDMARRERWQDRIAATNGLTLAVNATPRGRSNAPAGTTTRCTCQQPECPLNRRDERRRYGLERVQRAKVWDVDTAVSVYTNEIARLFGYANVLSNPLTLADFPDPREARLAAAFVKARHDPYGAAYDHFPELADAGDLVIKAHKLIDRQAPSQCLATTLKLAQWLLVEAVDRADFLDIRIVQIARWQINGSWEYQTYCQQDGVEELAALRRAGEAGAALLAAPMTPENLAVADELIAAYSTVDMPVEQAQG